MPIRRLAKDSNSGLQGGCPAIYSTDDPAQMIAQGTVLPDADFEALLDMQPHENAVGLPTETVFRGVAKYATEHGDDELAAGVEAFLAERGLG